MIPVAFREVEGLRLGQLEGSDPDGSIVGIKADSREVRPGDLFVALNAGVRYVEEVGARGAATLVPDDQNAALASQFSSAKASPRIQARAQQRLGLVPAGDMTYVDIRKP